MVELRVYGYGAIGDIPDAVYLGLIVLFVVGFGFLLWREGLRDGMRYSMRLLLGEWLFLILCTAVIFRESGTYSRINLIPLSSYFDIAENSYLMEVTAINILNVVMFIPVGLLLGLGFNPNLNEGRKTKYERRWLWVMMVGAGISVMIELLQLIFKRGLCEVDDVIHNVLGCMVGYGVYWVFVNVNHNDNHNDNHNLNDNEGRKTMKGLAVRS